MKIDLKNKKGIISTDIVIAMLAVLIFLGIMTALSYNAYSSAIEAKKTAVALNYAVDILEHIEQLKFSDVIASDELFDIDELEGFEYGETVKSEEGIEKIKGRINGYNIELEIEDYKNGGVVKKITLVIKYNISRKNQEKIELKTLKTIET